MNCVAAASASAGVSPLSSLAPSNSQTLSHTHTSTHSHAVVVTLAQRDTPPFFLLGLGAHDYAVTSS